MRELTSHEVDDLNDERKAHVGELTSHNDTIRIDVFELRSSERQYQISAKNVPAVSEFRAGFMVNGVWFEVLATITDQITNEVLLAIIQDREVLR